VSKNVVRLLLGQEDSAGLSETLEGFNIFIVGIELLGQEAPANEHTNAHDKTANQTSQEDRPGDGRGRAIGYTLHHRMLTILCVNQEADNRHWD
jgi:hypothetical protein